VKSARRYYSFTHYVNITSRNAVRIADSPAELVKFVAAYLAQPGLDAAGRKQVVFDQCQFTDGRSAERVAGLVLAELGTVSARAASTFALPHSHDELRRTDGASADRA
jgi:hypothetical protein